MISFSNVLSKWLRFNKVSFKKQKVWFKPLPKVRLKAVVLKKNKIFGNKILFRDTTNKCYKTWVDDHFLINRCK